MKKTRYCLLGLVFFSLFITPAFSQSSKLEVHIYRFFSGADNETGDGDIEHTWKFQFKDNFMANYGTERCHSRTTGHNTTNIWHVVDDVYVLKSYFNSVPTSFDFHLRGYEDDAGDRCEENNRDEQKESYFLSISPSALTPGVWSGLYTINPGSSGRYRVQFYLRYTPLAPNVQSVSPGSGLICADTPITLTSTINAPNKTGLSYEWQYNIQGESTPNPNRQFCYDDCYRMAEECELFGWGNCEIYYTQCPTDCYDNYPDLPVWKNLGTSTSESITVTPTSSIFTSGLFANTGVQFQVRAYTSQVATFYGASSGFKDFSPPAPTATSAPTTTPSCPSSATGSISVSGISKTFSTYRYILKRGDHPTLGCNPDLGNCITDVERSAEVSDATLVLTGLSANTYSLFLVNPGGAKGVCYNRIGGPIVVAPIPNLGTSLSGPAMVACSGESTGSVSITISNGRPDNVNYTLTHVGTNAQWLASSTTSNATVGFSSLPYGDYTLVANDGCTPPVAKDFSITQPAKVSRVEFEKADATCNLPGNGSMRVEVTRTSGANIVSTSANYSFTLTGEALPRTALQTDPNLTWSSLAPGDYTLTIREEGGAACNSVVETFTIAGPPPITISSIAVDSVNCFKGKDGSITFVAGGGTGAFEFSVSGDSVGTNTTPEFTQLERGNYYVTAKSPGGCTDSKTSPLIEVKEPLEISATITRTNISCNTVTDGLLESVVTGGSRGYTYTWQTELNNNWSDLSATGPSVPGRDAGLYRLIAKDRYQCESKSNIVEIIRPDAITIDSVKTSDIKCFGEKGNILLYGSGGTAPHTLEYAPVSSSVFSAFVLTTPINEGTYKVRIKDANGCIQTDGTNTYTITSPSEALDFNYALAEFNGFNISCYNGSNGKAKLIPSGGNGSTYLGYEFRLDSRPFILEDTLRAISAGNHLLSVKDGRGCVVSKTVNFSQAPALSTTTELKKDVDCHGEATGILKPRVDGGAGSFKYKLGPLTQDTARFEKLPAGVYTINIIDVNGCAIDHTDEIINLHAPIASTVDVFDVQCKNGTDGSITVTPTGGAPGAFTYELIGRGPTANPIPNLSAGIYDINVKDSKGCPHTITDIDVNEPDLLVIDTVSFKDIVCANETGTITMVAEGGTAPYVLEYSTDNGINFTEFTQASALGANNYVLRVVDDHDCITAHDEIVTITHPPAPLDFTSVSSDYNGFNISCYGGSNGYITLTPIGGNGAAYTGYEYALDGQSFQSDPLLKNINAGDHDIFIRDARACVVMKTITFTQSQDQLSGQLDKKEHVNCFYEQTGTLTVSGNGGVSPYKYWINPNHPQLDSKFTGLGTGNYVVIISDVNDCQVEVPGTIASINPLFTVALDVTNVNCFDGADGVVALRTTGGVTPFRYNWKGQTSTSDRIESLKHGTYEVTVTDNAGCFITSSTTVTQPPQPLTIKSVTTTTACYNQDNGFVNIVAEGGTLPYQYSIDNGARYHTSASINSFAGDFPVLVRDHNGCFTSTTTKVIQRNNPPEPNFLASSKQNARDTLVLTDISVPKPDSINWVFDAETTILKADEWNPEISFSSAGVFPVTMVSYFGDCAYPVTKNISLLPFDPAAPDESLSEFRSIQSLEVTPNPSAGDFTVTVTLNKPRNLSLVVFSVTGNIVYQNTYTDTDSVSQFISIQQNATGLYLVRAITENDARDARVIFNK